ncbi:MAG: hypothetical protein WC763_02770 [Candidatus Paceibacterota bacterium]|jgi:hypothetical protein
MNKTNTMEIPPAMGPSSGQGNKFQKQLWLTVFKAKNKAMHLYEGTAILSYYEWDYEFKRRQATCHGHSRIFLHGYPLICWNCVFPSKHSEPLFIEVIKRLAVSKTPPGYGLVMSSDDLHRLLEKGLVKRDEGNHENYLTLSDS